MKALNADYKEVEIWEYSGSMEELYFLISITRLSKRVVTKEHGGG
jgi:hypothetical protein